MLRSTFSTYCRLQVTIDAVDDVTGLSVIIKVEPRQGMPPPYIWRRFSYHSSNASDCVHRRRARCCSRTRRPAMVIVTSLWLVQLRGTVCPQNFDDQTCQWLCFVDAEELVIHCYSLPHSPYLVFRPRQKSRQSFPQPS